MEIVLGFIWLTLAAWSLNVPIGLAAIELSNFFMGYKDEGIAQWTATRSYALSITLVTFWPITIAYWLIRRR